MAAPVGVTSSACDSGRINRRALQQFHRRRSRYWKNAVSALYRSPADVQRRAHDLINAQRLGPDGGANDIDHRVHGAYFVKVNALNVAVVNFRLSRAQRLENRSRRGLCALADRGLAYHLANFLQSSSLSVFVRRGCRRPSTFIASLAVVVLPQIDRIMFVIVPGVMMTGLMHAHDHVPAPHPAGPQRLRAANLFRRRRTHPTWSAAIPLRVTREISNRAPISKAATVSSRSFAGTPASTRAPRNMSPLMPEKQSR